MTKRGKSRTANVAHDTTQVRVKLAGSPATITVESPVLVADACYDGGAHNNVEPFPSEKLFILPKLNTFGTVNVYRGQHHGLFV